MNQSMKVNPNELVIDLPLDEANVIVKMESMLKPDGMIQPVTVWLHDMRIIDGFHRTEAARRLGWTEIDVWVKDIDEESFWDGRIQSARQHHKVEGERLAVWMIECWKQTKWHVLVEPSAEGFLPRACSNASVDLSLVEMVWSVFVKKTIDGYQIGLDKLTEDERELMDWLSLRASQWGEPVGDLADKFMGAMGIERVGRLKDTYDHYARTKNLNLRQLLRLQKAVVREPGKYKAPSWEATDAFVDEKIIAGIDDGESWMDFSDRKWEKERADERQAEERAKAERDELEKEPGYQKHLKMVAEKAATSHVTERLRYTFNLVAAVKRDLIASPQGQELLAAFIDEVIQFQCGIWPQEAKPRPETESHKIAELRRQLRDAERDNGELRRALNGARAIKTNVLAMSSTDIESMASA